MVNRRILLSVLAAAALGACGTPPALAAGNLVDVQIVDRGRNSVLSEHRYRGATYVAGRPGDRYAIRLSNRTGARVMVVLSVDGVNAVSGETAATGQTGYVLAPWQTADITGWRKSYSEAAAFYFTALPDSYAARTDRPDNVGVIGAAVFRERVAQPRPTPFEPAPYSSGRIDGAGERQETERRAQSGAASDAAAGPGRGEGAANQRRSEAPAARPASPASPPPMPSAMAEASPSRERDSSSLAKAEKLGTGHGEREYSPMGRTSFERATSQPAELVQVRYDSYPNLLASGVIAPRRSLPEPFPGFAPDPRS